MRLDAFDIAFLLLSLVLVAVIALEFSLWLALPVAGMAFGMIYLSARTKDQAKNY